MDIESIGTTTQLPILRVIEHGAILDGGELGDILLPQRYMQPEFEEGTVVDVFVYFDSEDRIVATTETPFVKRNQFAFLDVKEVNRVGAFMEWGLKKDLFIPFREQKANIKDGGNYLVFCYYDEESSRLVGSTKVEKFLDNVIPEFERNDIVDILIVEEHEIGHRVIVNDLFFGMLYASDTFAPVHVGLKMKAYVKKVREDDKIDVSLQPDGVERIASQQDPIIAYLKHNDGFMPLTDKSDPELIYETFQMSKKTFKRAIGVLYKARRIRIGDNGIRLVMNSQNEDLND